MTIELTFNLDTVHHLAEHAAAAAGDVHPAGTANTGPALLLSSGANGIWLSSNGLPTLPAPAGQPGTLDRPAAFAAQCPPGTPWLQRVQLLRSETPLDVVLPLHEPTGHPLLAQLRAGADAGYTMLTVVLSGTGLYLKAGRRRERTRPRQTAGC